MSAKVNLTLTKFESPTSTTFGFLIYDEYGQTYCNNMDAAEWSVMDDMKLLAFAVEHLTEESEKIFENVRDMSEGITINGNYYEHSEIESVLG